MAAKRIASSDLNHDNWDHEDEPEDAGTFQKAPEEALKKRIIKTARRRNPISSVRDEDSQKKSAFTGFTAFSKAPTPTTMAFSFLSNLAGQTDAPKTNGIDKNKETSSKIDTIQPETAVSYPSSAFVGSTSKVAIGKSDDYYSKLKGLNESVSKWIKKHVDENPLINLQPIFKDYEKYFKELEKEAESKLISDSNNKAEANKVATVSSMGTFVFKAAENVPDTTTGKTQMASEKFSKVPEKLTKGSDIPNAGKTQVDLDKSDTGKSPMESDNTNTTQAVPKFSFGSSLASTITLGKNSPFGFSSTATSNTFSFATSNSSTTTSTPSSFSFGTKTSNTGYNSFPSPAPFTFANVAKPMSTVASNKESEEEDTEPPKNDFKPVVEDNYIYTTRCKVFVKKDDNFGDRGVGNLYLKPIENSEKVQLIVRADTNLGNLLCNFILSKNIPTKRMGKKDVMLVCLPSPDIQPPPIPILLRVKSPEDADNLLETLEKHKK